MFAVLLLALVGFPALAEAIETPDASLVTGALPQPPAPAPDADADPASVDCRDVSGPAHEACLALLGEAASEEPVPPPASSPPRTQSLGLSFPTLLAGSLAAVAGLGLVAFLLVKRGGPPAR